MKKQLTAALLIAVLLAGALPVSAAESYRGYTYDAYGNSVPSQIGYTADKLVTAQDIDASWGQFRSPADLCLTDRGELYILDSGNGRIAVTDADLSPAGLIDTFTLPDGQKTALQEASGIFADNDGHLYVADTGNRRVLRCDKNGQIDRVFTEPDSDVFQKETEFKPLKVTVDQSGYVYVLVQGVYEGAVVYAPDGTFETFFGSNRVEVSLKLLADMAWKRIMSDEQLGYLSQYVPDEFSNFDTDSDGFIFTCTAATSTSTDRVKKLNSAGINVLRTSGAGETLSFGDKETGWVNGAAVTSQLADIQAENGYIRVLDVVRGRVFEYDANGELLLIFGGLGQQVGTFRNPVALEAYRDRVYVLDSASGSVTVFSLTDFGRSVHTAVELFNEGLYDKARDSWQDILSLDANYALAYTGIGKALSADKRYEEAAKWFRLANNRAAESDAFGEYRAQWIQRHFVWIVLFIAAAIAALVLLRRFPKKADRRRKAPEERLFSLLIHPIAVSEERKQKKQFGWLLPTVTGLLLFCTTMLRMQATGFRFNAVDTADISLWAVFASTTVLFAAAIAVNWAVCTLMDGKGHLVEIANVGACALLPYIGSLCVTVLLSHVLTLDERTYTAVISAAAVLWAFGILFGGLSAIHEYSFSKTVASLLLTAVGMLILAFIVLLAASLLQQTWSFLRAVVTEIVYRLS